MKLYPVLSSIVYLTLSACSTPSSHHQNNETPILDSIAAANTQSVLESGNNITKAYINPEDSSFFIVANMRLDHRMIGYQNPDTTSAGLILFSIFTNDVDGNPFGYPLGAYYDSYELEHLNLKYAGQHEGFAHILAKKANSEPTSIYFEQRWIAFENEELGTTLADDVLEDFGQITSVEDGPYPYFIVRVNFEDREFFIDFDLNIESIDMNMDELYGSKNKYARIHYTSELENNLLDLRFGSASLFGESAPEETNPEQKSFSGILSGAQSETASDIPSTITLTNDFGEVQNFKLFIDETTKSMNGKNLTAYYNQKVVNEIVGITLTEND
jgi:hypothetical protein